ncbi:hypothetical protein HPB52_008329 [Rhipicephalus sanguineus]|uniref:Secreted protein n=2 Tax=Rhipicephalus sanguineus TaxID=34632 RepID=A0A9D4QJG7_RHISA|nr:hypothetical protein HPB52_008329 [Rhipicephalus sanguineus]
MKAFVSFLGAVLYLATCDGYEVVEVSTLRQRSTHDSACDAARFEPQRQLCDDTFKLNIPHNHGDMKFVCAVIGKYKMCLANAIQATGCDNKEFLIKQLQPMQQYIQENHIECIPEVNASSQSRAPTGYRAKLDLCTRDKAWETQFLCAKKFHTKLRKIEDDKEVESHQICRSLSRYYSCLNTVLHSESCEEDTELMMHMEYFPKVLTQKYREMCYAELKLTAMNVAKRLEVTTDKPPIIDPTDKPPAGCVEDQFMEKYFECGLLYVYNLRDAMYGDNPQHKNQVCETIERHNLCLEEIKKSSSCQSLPEIQASLDYLTNELHQAPGIQCTKAQYKRSGKIRFRTSEQNCLVREYAGTFFTCGTIFLMNTYPNPPSKDEDCRHYNQYLKCYSLLIPCTQQSDIKAAIGKFSDILTEGYADKCRGVKLTDKDKRRIYLGLERQTTCDQFKAIKKLVLCGVTFHRMLVALGNGTQGKDNRTEVCPLVKEMKYCMYSATHDSGCSDALFLNTEISVLKKYMLMEFEDACNTLPSSEDQEFKVYRQACELKEFTHEWESCDSAMEDDISLFYRNGSALRKTAISNRVRRRLCTDLVGYRKCLNDSADKHHCSAVAPQVAEMSNELFDRLGLIYCSGCSRRTSAWVLMTLASAASWLTRMSANLS